MTSGPSWTTSQKSLRQQRYIYTPSSPFCSLFLYHFLSLCSFLWAVCLLFSMKDILVSGSLTSCHVLSRDILSLCSKYLSKCALFSVHCFFSQIEDETQVSRATQAEQDHYEMHVRAANIVSISSVFQNKLRAQMF